MNGNFEVADSRKKKGQKKGSVNVPLSELGFKSKVYYDIETEYTRRRVKYKAARYGVQNGKECFMGRLTFIVDPTTFTHEEMMDLPNFKGIKKHQWDKIKQIVYHTRDQLTCAICLQKDFKAPQMTSCGHVFCWHCIYMHHYKSLKANHCPVCNQTIIIESVISCKPIFGRSFKQIQQNKVKFNLKCRMQGDTKIYDSITHEQDINFARVLKVTGEKVLQLYYKQKQEVQSYLKICDDQQISKWLQKIVSLCWQKIEKVNQQVGKKHYHLHKHEKEVDGIIFSVLQNKSNLIYFYQQFSGKFIFLHQLCDKYLRKYLKEMPNQIEEEIRYWEEVEYNLQASKRYKFINHLVVNQEIDLIIVQMKNIIGQAENKQFQAEYEHFKVRKQEEIKREDKESERLQVKYEQQKQYMKQLKKMEESQFYDIKLPTTINPNQLGNAHFFPSLISVKSTPEAEAEPPIVHEPKHKRLKKHKQNHHKIINEGDFPELFAPLAPNQSESSQIAQSIVVPELITIQSQEPIKTNAWKQQQFPQMKIGSKKKIDQQQSPTKFQKKASRRKKDKFVNVTDQFFQQPKEQNQDES